MNVELSPVQVWALFTILALLTAAAVALHDWIERGIERRKERIAYEQLKRGGRS